MRCHNAEHMRTVAKHLKYTVKKVIEIKVLIIKCITSSQTKFAYQFYEFPKRTVVIKLHSDT